MILALAFGYGLAATGMVYLLFYLFLILPTRWLKIERIRHPLGIGKKILQISDVHIERNRVPAMALERLIRRERPDMICITGDFTEKSRFLPRLIPYLSVIHKSGVPAYAVLGNHDYRLPRIDALVVLLQKYSVEVLRNQSVPFENFTLIGIDDFCSGHHDPETAFRYTERHKPIVVLTHDPNLALELTRPYDYMMAGHFHGKQCKIPFLFRMVAKGKLPEQGIYEGLHRLTQGPLYISKGLGQAGLNIRFLVRSEIAVHEL